MAILGSPPSKWKINTDGDILPRKTTANLRIEKEHPAVIFRNTDYALPDGLWRIRGSDDALFLEANTALDGDFSTTRQTLLLALQGIAVAGSISILESATTKAILQFGNSTDPDDIDSTGLWAVLAGTDDRLHFKDTTNTDHVLAYFDEITDPGNTVLVSEYIVRETPTGDVDGMNDTFMLANTPEVGTEQVYVNGLLQDVGATEDYTIVTDTITFNDPPEIGDKIRVTYVKA
jgi:hypothetical protein